MKKLAGRPKLEITKNHKITVRIDKVTFDKVRNYCYKKKITESQALREFIKMALSE